MLDPMVMSELLIKEMLIKDFISTQVNLITCLLS